MGKTIFSIVLVLFIGLYAAAPVRAQAIAGSSAAVTFREQTATSSINIQKLALKRKALVQVLKKYDAVLLSEVDSFLEACTTYDLDCYLLPSISGVESTFGKFLIPSTHNPFGWGRGILEFDTFHDAIMAVGKGLRNGYLDKGATTVDEIGAIYCEGNTWSGKVNYFMAKFQEEEQKQLFFMQDTVQL
jgi:hypothetical protein